MYRVSWLQLNGTTTVGGSLYHTEAAAKRQAMRWAALFRGNTYFVLSPTMGCVWRYTWRTPCTAS